MSKKLADANDPFTSLVKNFKWTNADQNGVAADLENGMTAEEAAKKWIDANAATVASWVGK
jgi:glycine betaine/proline transport system substrate-binding protein